MSEEAPLVAVVADDLIWASRLGAAVERAAARPTRVRGGSDLEILLSADPTPPHGVAAVVVDLNGRAYDGVEAVAAAARSGRPVIAVGQHEDIALRKRALAAGADRVYSYNKLFRDGPRVIERLLGTTGETAAEDDE